jgi:glyoxylase-like metal-dependent hydrolase (beta-lactamase superfamily II)
MILRQFLHTDPVVAISYLFGCGGKAVGAVVDPVAEPDVYLGAARDAGLRIHYVIDTHVHADHVSSGRALARAAGVEYVLHEAAGAHFAFHGVGDGERLELGNVSVAVWHVPGHTPEHVALVVTDRTRANEPWLVFTGHTLLVGDMGRTELAASAEAGALALFDSAFRLRTLADPVVVLPGAFSGSVCGRGLSGVPLSTIGFERRHNRAFSITDRAPFVQQMLREIPPRPERAAELRAINMGVTDRPDVQGSPLAGVTAGITAGSARP